MRRFSLGDKPSWVSDRKHAEINYKIKKTCIRTGDRRHAEINCKVNSSVGGCKEPEGSLEELLLIYGWFWNLF